MPSPANPADPPPPAAVHLDLDGARHIFQVHGWHYPLDHDPLFVSGLTHALKVFQQHSLKATLFVIAEDLQEPAKRELIIEAVRQGHAIASHTTTHRPLPELPPEQKAQEIIASRQHLASELGVAVHGFRAPGFKIDRETLELVAQAGYRYDSSLMAGRMPSPQIAATPPALTPFRPLEGSPLFELPLPAFTPFNLPFHPSYSLLFGLWYFNLGLRSFRRLQAPLILLFHLTDFAEPLDRQPLKRPLETLYTLSHLTGAAKIRRCRRMLAAVQQHYRLTETQAVIERFTGDRTPSETTIQPQ